MRIERLAKSHQREGFDSDDADLDDWIRHAAGQNQRADNAAVFVLADGDQVAGYYALAMGSVIRADAPQAMKPSRRPVRIPVALLGRLAVDRKCQGRGLGAELLRDAVLRTARVSAGIGCAALAVNCADQRAKDFYLHLLPFLESPVDPLLLLMPTAAIRAQADLNRRSSVGTELLGDGLIPPW
ncbi:MAG: GNAT family N-acetyltransferase [Bifidobacteriaceae bacterium]|nr:GNAT family N-acetyltransferase [Bifidobacteriaceae bacterium]